MTPRQAPYDYSLNETVSPTCWLLGGMWKAMSAQYIDSTGVGELVYLKTSIDESKVFMQMSYDCTALQL